MRSCIYISLFTFLVSCSSDNWTNDEQKKFVYSCREEGGSKNYCECYMNNVMLENPIAEDAETMSFENKIELSKNCQK
jgi:hypothetical protein